MTAQQAHEQPQADPETPQCSVIEDVMGVLGRAWAGAVLQAALAGAERFSEFKRRVPGVSDAVLSTRLKELTERGFFVRDVDPGPPTQVRYRMTEVGREVEPVLSAAVAFAAQHPGAVR
ncbi:winged helix-turn-helix transcriptional regulator [Propionibacteriaceae bacterium Y1923]|uniref:winged helix-turn-helix transcriptional regulator n=1 Tax=Aestuariimicrobium sp. Y1814 TaxID=3418742 RepID=UPI003C2152DF